MRGYIDWMGSDGFWVRNTWDAEKKRMKGEGKLALMPEQKRILGYALRFNEEGLLHYDTVLYSCIKKSGKSAIGASVGCWYAEEADPGTEIYVIANTLEQGAGRVFRDISFHFSKRQEEFGRKYCKISEYRIDFPNGTFIQVLSQSFKSVAGSRHALTIWDELWGNCVTPNTKVLKADLTWVPASELREGDRLISFDEEKQDGAGYRNWKYATVEATGLKTALAVDIHLKSGKTLTATVDHKWLARRKQHNSVDWVESKDLKPGYRLMKVLEPWEELDTRTAGYIAGALDGEGSLIYDKNGGTRLDFTQRRNVMWDEMMALYDEMGVTCYYDTKKNLNPLHSAADMVITRKSEIMKVLGSTRPVRLLPKFNVEKMGRQTAIEWDEVESTSLHYETQVVPLTTSTGTYVAEGYCAHNTGEFDRRVWDEMVPIPTVTNSLRFIATYAGFENESELLWELFLRGIGEGEGSEYESKGQGKVIEELAGLPAWENGKLFTYWSHEPTMPWQTEEFLDEQRAAERPAAYLRLWMNMWVTSHEEFIPVEWWDRAAKMYKGPATVWGDHPFARWPITIGVDAGVRRDSTAIVGVGYDSHRGKVGVVFHWVWKPSTNDPVDLEATVEMKLRELKAKFNISSIVYDPTHLLTIMLKLQREGFPTHIYEQTVPNMVAASQLLFDLFKNNNMESYPDDELRRQIQMAVAETTARGFRIVKSKLPIKHTFVDAAVAMAMASYDAVSNGGVDTSIPVVLRSPYDDMTIFNGDENQLTLPPELRSTDVGYDPDYEPNR